MSGNYRSKKEVAHLLVPGIGRKIVDLGEDIQKAHTYKLIANSMILGTLEILGEAYTLGEKSGIGGDNVHRLVQGSHPIIFKQVKLIYGFHRNIPCSRVHIEVQCSVILTNVQDARIF